MRKLGVPVLVLALMTTLGVPLAQSAASPADLVVEEVLERSGITRQIAQIQGHLAAQGNQRLSQVDPKDQAAVTDVLRRAFHPEAIHAAVKETFVADFDQQRAAGALAWLRSPVSRRLVDLEVAASSPEAMQGMQEFAGRLQNSPPTEKRLALVQGLDDATEATALTLDLVTTAVRGIASAVDPMLPPEKRLKEGDLEEFRRGSSHTLRMTNLVMMLFAYRAASDDELFVYLQFYRSDAGQWLVRSYRKGLLNAIAGASRRAGEELGRAGLGGRKE